jgi:hypothetical protein
VDGSDTRYCSGDDIRAGDRVRCGDWTGRVVFVLGTGSFALGFRPADWSYLGRGFMAEYDQAGLVFSEKADADLELVARAEPGAAADGGGM